MIAESLPEHVQGTLRAVRKMPESSPVAVLIRHAERDPIAEGHIGMEAKLTEAGVRNAREFGRVIGERLAGIESSPVGRCIQTSKALLEGASSFLSISESRLLGDPGVFVVDEAAAFENWRRFGNEGVMSLISTQNEPLPGMADPQQARRQLLDHILNSIQDKPGVHLFVTHDVILAGVVGGILGLITTDDPFPRFLEGAIVWQDAIAVHVGYREKTVRWRSP